MTTSSHRPRRGEVVEAVFAARSPLMIRFFGKLFQRDLASAFHAVRCSGTVPAGPGPLVIFANHPSWWDGEIFSWLIATMLRDRRCFVPIDASMLERYRFFRKLGAFAVTPGYAGAATFLAVGSAVLAQDNGVLLVNAEGRFRDARERGLSLMPGLMHLSRKMPEARFVPLAIEYAFWNERRPNVLLRFGEPVARSRSQKHSGSDLRDALVATMDALASDATTRDPAHFTTLLAGKTKINPFYDAWRRVQALLRGRRFDPAHGASPDTAGQ